MLSIYILFLLSSNAVTLRRDKSILYLAIVITIIIFCVILLKSYFICFNCKDTGDITGQLSYTVNMTNHPHYLVSLITVVFMEEFIFILVFHLLYNFAKIKRLVRTCIFSLSVPVTLVLICLLNKLPAFYFLVELGFAPLCYLISALFIILITNIR